MLRRIRFLLLCCAAALGWITAGTLDMLGAVDLDDDLVLIAGAGLITVALLGHIGAQMNAHRVRHVRADRQLGGLVDLGRASFEVQELPVHPALIDEREHQPGADVVRLRPRGSAPRHSKARVRRPGA